jgi:hypothetical protein
VRNKIALLFLATCLISACTGKSTPAPELPTPTFTLQASPTPGNPLVILILPADMSQKASDGYQTLVYNLAQENGMRFQVRNTLTVDDLQAELPSLKIVIALPPDPGLAVLAAAAPGVQFLSLDIAGVLAGANISTIGGADQAVDKQAFLAGYITAMLASEWRTGLLTVRDTPDGDATWTAFENGYHYYCGYCRNPGSFSPPFNDYPIVYRIPTDTPENEYTGWAAGLLDNFVKAAYVFSPVATPDVLSYLADYGILLVGQDSPSDDIRSNWIASIQPDVIPAILDIFPQLLAGNGGQVVPTPLFLTDINDNLLTEGKLRMVQEVLDGLQDGTIGTGVVP